jgi:hypothetical protein
MALNLSGVISLGGSTAGQSVNLELGQAAGATISLNDTNLRTIFGVASGIISLSQGYGKSSYSTNSTKVFWSGTVATGASIKGMEFPTETAITSAASLVQARYAFGGTHTSVKGYFLAGRVPATGPRGYATVTQIDGLAFSTDTAIDPAGAAGGTEAGITTITSAAAGYANSGSFKYNFATETMGTFIRPLAQVRNYSANSQNQTKGYFLGGINTVNGAPNFVAEIDGILFANDTLFNPAAGIVQPRGRGTGHNSPTSGYACGGEGWTYNTYYGQIDGIAFASETTIDPGAGMIPARTTANWGSNSSTRGYCHGGTSGLGVAGQTLQIDGIVYASGTAVDPATALTASGSGGGLVQNSNN